MMWLYILAAIIVILAFWLIAMFNSLIRQRNRVTEAWSDIEVQLKRRYDLIPNLMETVKGYASHERGVFEEVTKTRTQAMQATGLKEKSDAENMLSGTLKSLFAVAENYPDLKANENYLELQRELSDTENKVQAARRFYNGNVRDFNTKQQVFPTNIFASMMGFKISEFFGNEDEAAREPVKVDFKKE